MTWDVEIVTLENDDDGVFVSWSGDFFFFEATDASSGGFWHFFWNLEDYFMVEKMSYFQLQNDTHKGPKLLDQKSTNVPYYCENSMVTLNKGYKKVRGNNLQVYKSSGYLNILIRLYQPS